MTPVCAAALLAGALFLGLGLIIEERRRQAPPLPTDAPTGEHDPASTTVLLPVRDEALNLGPCVAALLALDGQPAVCVVDDGSTDGTAALAAALAAGEPRLSVVSAGPLPAGWRGKVHALWYGAQRVDSPWLLLTDADVRQRPAALRRALAAAAAGHFDAVSFAGYQEARGLAENLLVPAVFALLDATLGDWRAAAAGAGATVANGQFLLVRRAAWEDCGGFATVAAATMDDVAVAVTLRRDGYRTAFFRAPHLLAVRMYRGWSEVTHGWRRNLGSLFGARRRATPAILAGLLLPPLALTAFLAAGDPVAAALLWAAGAATSGILRTGSGHRPLYALLYPLDAILLAWLLAVGARDRRRGYLASWKGRDIAV